MSGAVQAECRRVPQDDLAALKAQRDELSRRIDLIEKGIERAAYDMCTARQLASVNASRKAEGKPSLSMDQFLAGVGEEEES